VSHARSRRALRTGLTVLVIGGVLAILRPWTVVPIQTATVPTFEPAGYVASVWESRVLPTAEGTAIDLQSFMQGRANAGAARAVFVKGTAKVADVDRKSRVGLARLALPWAMDGQAAIQIGPVIRGTALRDALDFIRFTDFVNQIEFAGVASALNDHVVTAVLQIAPGVVPGAEVTFVGAVPVSASTQTPEIVPVKLTVAGVTR
jgi:predicted lipoprotein